MEVSAAVEVRADDRAREVAPGRAGLHELPAAVGARALVWVAATLPLQGLFLLGWSRRALGERGPIVYLVLLGLCWLGLARGAPGRDRLDWIVPRGELLVHALLLVLMLSLAVHGPRAHTLFELALGAGVVAYLARAPVWMAGPRQDSALAERDPRGARLLLTCGSFAGGWVFAASLLPSEQAVIAALLLAVFFVAVPAGVLWGAAWLATRFSGVERRGERVVGRQLALSTRPLHGAATLFVMTSCWGWGGLLLPVMLGISAADPPEPAASRRGLARLLFPLALPLLGAALLHVVDPPAVRHTIAASHAVVGVLFAALAPVLPALALAVAGSLDRARGLRGVPGLGAAGFALLIVLAVGDTGPQVALARVFGRDLLEGTGAPAWHGFPLEGVQRAAALAGLALAAWVGLRAWRLFRDGGRPALLPLAAAAASAAVAGALRIPAAGAQGAAEGVLLGGLAGLLVELGGRLAFLRGRSNARPDAEQAAA